MLTYNELVMAVDDAKEALKIAKKQLEKDREEIKWLNQKLNEAQERSRKLD